jgi:hypothetical protein
MTTEELLPHIKALTEIDFANLMRELKTHVQLNGISHCFSEAGCPTTELVDTLESELDDMTDETLIQAEKLSTALFNLDVARLRITELENEIEELKGNALLNQAENAARGI